MSRKYPISHTSAFKVTITTSDDRKLKAANAAGVSSPARPGSSRVAGLRSSDRSVGRSAPALRLRHNAALGTIQRNAEAPRADAANVTTTTASNVQCCSTASSTIPATLTSFCADDTTAFVPNRLRDVK